MTQVDATDYLKSQIAKTLRAIDIEDADAIEIGLERPRIAEHGDLSTNVAMQLASKL